MDDKINPSHYKQGKIETIDMIESATGDGFEGYLAGNIIKYVSRYKYKNGVTDLKKARWYLDKLIEHTEIKWPDWCKTCKADKSHCDKCEILCNGDGPIDYPPSEYVGEKKEGAQEEMKTCGMCGEYCADIHECRVTGHRVVSTDKACSLYWEPKDE